MPFTYIIKCKDETYYTGIAKDIYSRMAEHLSKSDKCAKYTKARGVKSLEILWETKSLSNAAKLEFRIKKLTRAEKKELIENPGKFSVFFAGKLEVEEYELKKDVSIQSIHKSPFVQEKQKKQNNIF